MSPIASPPSFDANSTLGALEIGVLIATCLFGALTVQVYIYYARFPQDPWGIKAMVRTGRISLAKTFKLRHEFDRWLSFGRCWLGLVDRLFESDESSGCWISAIRLRYVT